MNLSRHFLGWKNPPIGGAALCLMLGLLFWTFGLGEWLANLSYDLGYLLRPAATVEGAVMVFMDEASCIELKQPINAPWDRAFHAQLIDRLADARAKAVVFDVLMPAAGTNEVQSASDRALIEAIAHSTRRGTPIVVAGDAVESALDAAGRPQRTVIGPFEALRQVAAWGLPERVAEDQIIRSHYPGEAGVPSLAWKAAELTLSELPRTVAVRRWINFYGPPRRKLHFHSFKNVLAGKESASSFSNQVVFVGSSIEIGYGEGRRPDSWPTPYTRGGRGKAPGVEINATVYLNLKQRDWLNQLPEGIELLLFLGFGAAIGYGLPWCRPMVATGLAVVIGMAIAAIAFWSMWHELVWFSWLVPAAVQTPAALGWSILCHTRRLSEEKDLLEQKIAVLQPALEMAGARPHSGAPTKVASMTSNPAGAPPSAPSFETAPPMPGAPVVSDHTLLRCVGKGAYGEVWLARNAIGLFHAVKVVYRAGFSSQEPFEREFRGIQKFMPVSRLHPGLVQVLQVGRNEAAGYFYYVMEPADDANDESRSATGNGRGPAEANLPSSFVIRDSESYLPRTLTLDLERRRRLPARDCIHLGLALTSALEFLHAHHLIHRDIKPANIIFVRSAPKLADIGLVTDIATTGTDATYIGTKGYIPPEGPGKPAADIYSLGRVLYEAAMGLGARDFPQLPGTLLERADRDLLLDLNPIIVKASEDDLALRYSSAAQMRADLERLKSL